MILVIYGEERILMQQKLNALKKEHDCNEDNMNYSVYHADEDGMESVYEDLITPSFFTEKKMVVLKNPYFLTTKKEKKENTDIEVFNSCLSADLENVIFIIYHDVHNFDERKKLVKELRKKATIFEIEKMNHYKLSETVRKAVLRRESTISDDALHLLLSRIGSNLTMAIMEVDKLCLYTKSIEVQDVDALVTKPLEENVFDLTSAILNKEHQKIFSIYKDLMTLNEEPIKLIVLLANQMRLLYQVKILDRKGYTDKEIAKMLSINPYRLRYIRQEGRDFQVQDLLESLHTLSDLDIAIKTGKIDKKQGLELFLIRI
ncbi:MAG: DNA polymerase III subunit delta [Coprobacillaceae bacterium]